MIFRCIVFPQDFAQYSEQSCVGASTVTARSWEEVSTDKVTDCKDTTFTPTPKALVNMQKSAHVFKADIILAAP